MAFSLGAVVLTEKLLLRRSVLGEYQLGAEEAFSSAQAAFSDQDFVTTMSSEEGVHHFWSSSCHTQLSVLIATVSEVIHTLVVHGHYGISLLVLYVLTKLLLIST